jgi:ribosomal protein S18 acetylase RimI-like enzyme
VRVTECRRSDLKALDRALPSRDTGAHRSNFAQHESGRWTMLVAWADADTPAGVGLIRWSADGAGAPKLTNLQVAERHRGQGVATALIAGAEARVRQRGRHRLVIDVADDNPRAARLYLRLGYVDTGRIVESRYQYPDETGRVVQVVEHNHRLVKDLDAGPA